MTITKLYLLDDCLEITLCGEVRDIQSGYMVPSEEVLKLSLADANRLQTYLNGRLPEALAAAKSLRQEALTRREKELESELARTKAELGHIRG